MFGELEKSYSYYFEEMGDKRVKDWPLMKDGIKPVLIAAVYLYMVYSALPKYMRNRKQFSLKRIIQFYNLFQICSCIIVLYFLAITGWATHLTLGCEPVDYSDDPKANLMLNTLWWVTMLKVIEFVETFFFILRKKNNQVTYLHVYHHVSTFFLSWICTKYVGGGMVSFSILLNTFVHVIMYSYYFLSTLGGTIQKKLSFMKSKITAIQLAQFVIMIIHGAQGFQKDCKIAPIFNYSFVPDITILLLFFLNFYIKQYTTKKKVK